VRGRAGSLSIYAAPPRVPPAARHPRVKRRRTTRCIDYGTVRKARKRKSGLFAVSPLESEAADGLDGRLLCVVCAVPGWVAGHIKPF
jgi:hypothetical protein